MLKKLSLVVMLITPLSVLACWGSGFYIGAGIGSDTTDFNVTSYVSQPGNFNVINKTELAAQGVLGDLFAGYSWHRNWFYLAGELNGNISSAKFNTSNDELVHSNYSQTSYKINPTWGVSLLPGVLLPETTLLYGRVGYTDGKFVINTTDISLANDKTWLSGLRLGVGLEKRIYNKIGLRAEYSHISYKGQSETVFDPVGNVTKETNVDPDSNQFELGIDYRF